MKVYDIGGGKNLYISIQKKMNADLIICKALLEHVKDVDKAFASISSILKPGGSALIFVPSKNALYARLNVILPEKTKKKLLYSIFPRTRSAQGFPSYYDKCSPNDFYQLAKNYKFTVVDENFYYISSCFSFLFPLYFLWRIWIMIYDMFAGKQAAETFSMALRKNN